MGCASAPFSLHRYPTPANPTSSAAADYVAANLLPANLNRFHWPRKPFIPISSIQSVFRSFPSSLSSRSPTLLRPLAAAANHNGGDNNNGGGRNGGGGGGGGDWWDDFFNFDKKHFLLFPFSCMFTNGNDIFASVTSCKPLLLLLVSVSSSLSCGLLLASLVQAKTNTEENDTEVLYEIRGGRRVELVADHFKDEFIVPRAVFFWWPWGSNSKPSSFRDFTVDLWMQCRNVAMNLMLPEGFPESVTSDYLEYSLWRAVQGVAAQISGVLATQVPFFLLYVLALFI